MKLFFSFFFDILLVNIDYGMIKKYVLGSKNINYANNHDYLFTKVEDFKIRQRGDRSTEKVYYYDLTVNLVDLYNVKSFRQDVVLDYYYFNRMFFRVWFYK